MPKPSPIDDIATTMANELDSDTKAIAASLAPEIQQVGASKMSRAEYLAYLHRNWTTPTFRTDLLKQVGNKAFIEAAQDMVAAHGHPPVPPPLDLSGMLGGQPPGAMMGPPPMAPPNLTPGGS